MEILVSTSWLADQLGSPNLKIVDATAFLPGTPRDPRAEYLVSHIPGAIYLDLATLNDDTDPRPAMVPTNEQFSRRMAELGINDDDQIVVYDNSPLSSSGRAWWLFRIFGAKNVAVLDGGLGRWVAENRPTEAGIGSAPANTHFAANRDDRAIATKADVLDNLTSCAAQVVDARSGDRFRGEAAEPRPGMAEGHIPGSANVPTGDLLDDDGLWKRGDALRQAFADANVDLGKPLIMSCGSGVTACNLLFGAALLEKADVRIYDGSWSEWGADPATPKAVGPA